MEKYTYQQFTHDVMGDTDASFKRGGPVTVTSMVEDQGFISSLIVAQKDRLPKEVVEHHEQVLQGLSSITYGAIQTLSRLGPRSAKR